MNAANTLFQQHCEKVLRKFEEADVEAFKKIDDDVGRIKFVYDYAKNMPVGAKDGSKNFETAQKEKALGNSYFSKKDYNKTAATYSSAIIKCPQNTDDEKEFVAILISNRSAAYFELKKYESVLKDIEYLTFINKYPKHLMYKVLLRKAKCLHHFENYNLAVENYQKAMECLKQSNLDDKVVTLKLKEIEEQLQLYKGKNYKAQTVVKHTKNEQFCSNIKFPAVHFDVMFDEDNIQGRFARAAENISAGTVIVQENAHCAVLDAKYQLTNCQNCLISTNQPIACENCAHVIFCSLKCLQEAKQGFHQTECNIQTNIFSSGASINCSMALRIITQKKLSYFLEKRNTLEDYSSGLKLDEFKNKIYISHDYDTVFFLCRNENVRKNEQLLHYTCMAIFLLRYLKNTTYFGGTSQDDVLTDEESFIGSLILRHLQILQFNAHEISELCNGKSEENSGYVSEYIGGGLYPTLALFNHSCDPSIVRYNIGTKMIAHAVKPIKAGDIIYENYGPLYTTTEIEKRQFVLKDRYWFECLCKPCVEMWSSLDEMNEEILRLPCKRPKCPKIFQLKKDTDNPFLTCNFCNETTSIFPYLKGLMNLEALMPEAESLFNFGDFDGALEKFLIALDIYYKYTAPPCVDLVKVQQRLRMCLIHKGNKSTDYLGLA